MRLDRKYLVAIAVIVVIALVFFAAWHGPSSPEGRYTADPNIGIAGDFWWELSAGKVELIGGGTNTYCGRYFKKKDRWYWMDDSGRKTNLFRIDSTWWRLRTVHQATGEAWTWGFRRFWPGQKELPPLSE